MAATDIRPPRAQADARERSDPTKDKLTSYLDVADVVSSWPIAMRLDLMHYILRTLDDELYRNMPRPGTLEAAQELLRSDEPPPDDAEVERIINEARSSRR